MTAPTATLRVVTPQGTHRLGVPVGVSVRDALDTTDLRVRAACGGTGSCGACVVTLVGGVVSAPTVAECMKLPPADRAAGRRMACQLRLLGDAEVRIDDPAPPSQWKSIPPERLFAHALARPDLAEHPYGVAVDLGTTHIRLSLWDRRQGHRIATRQGANPQGMFGADVLNRLAAAAQRPERATEIATLARVAIVDAVRDILKRDVGEVSPMLAEIGAVHIVGNTAMHALLSGEGIATLLDPVGWHTRVDFQPRDAAAFTAQWFMPNAEIRLHEAVAGFVGADLLADLLATGLADGPPGSLSIDLGTNTEIALWDGERLHVTAVPGGPAFEGVGLRNGMPAEPGAICRVGPGRALATIGGCTPRGYCGSGLVDAIAVLRADGVLKASGRFETSPGPGGYHLDAAQPASALFAHDIDAFQRAKAATAAAMGVLLERAGMAWGDLRRLCVCGAFGQTLDIAHAQAVGLLPAIDPARVELCADASLAGCEIGLLATDGPARFVALAARAQAVNLALVSDYDDRYLEQLRLRPICA